MSGIYPCADCKEYEDQIEETAIKTEAVTGYLTSNLEELRDQNDGLVAENQKLITKVESLEKRNADLEDKLMKTEKPTRYL